MKTGPHGQGSLTQCFFHPTDGGRLLGACLPCQPAHRLTATHTTCSSARFLLNAFTFVPLSQGARSELIMMINPEFTDDTDKQTELSASLTVDEQQVSPTLSEGRGKAVRAGDMADQSTDLSVRQATHQISILLSFIFEPQFTFL